MNSAPLINIVIPVFNQWEITRDCLTALRRTTPGDFFEVTVVDNGSTDATPVECPTLGAELFGMVFRYERFGENRHLGPARNHGAIASPAPFVFFLNNDTIPTEGWHEPLLEAFGTMPGLGAVGPLLLYPGHDRVQHLGVAVDPGFGMEHLYEYFPVSHPAVARQRSLQALTAAAVMVPRNLFLDCGGFHEGYVNGFEDVDLSLTIREAGRTLSVAPESVVYHMCSQSQGRFDGEQRNAALLTERWGHRIKPDLHLHAREDGFVLRVTPMFETCVALPGEREEELDREFDGVSDPAVLWGQIIAEPLWFGGYDRLAEVLEQAGMWEEVFEARMLQCALGPSLGRLERLRDATVRVGDAAQLESVVQRIVPYRRLLCDPHAVQQRGRGLADRLHRAGEAGLERVIRTAMRRAMEPGFDEGGLRREQLGCIDPASPGAA